MEQLLNDMLLAVKWIFVLGFAATGAFMSGATRGYINKRFPGWAEKHKWAFWVLGGVISLSLISMLLRFF